MSEETATIEQLSGLEKASLLMIILGAERASNVLQLLSPEEVQLLGGEIAKRKQVPPQAQAQVITELVKARGMNSTTGGMEYAKELLQAALGPAKAEQLFEDIVGGRPFDWIKTAGTPRLAKYLMTERPQVIALVLGNLRPDEAAEVLSQLPQDVQGKVAYRLTNMHPVAPQIVKTIDEILRNKLAKESTGNFKSVGGLQALVTILNNADRPTETKILEYLQETEASIAQTIREMMFVFEDMVNLDDRTLQIVIRELDQDDLRLSLKGAADVIKDAFFRNMSERAAEALKEDLEMMGPVRARDVEAARRRVVAVVRRLEEIGQINIRQNDEDIVA